MGSEDEFLVVEDESTDDDGSIAYIDYEMNEDVTDSETAEDGGFFVEYVNEIDDETVSIYNR